MTSEEQLKKKYSKGLSDKLKEKKLPEHYFNWIWNKAYDRLRKNQKEFIESEYFKSAIDCFIVIAEEKFLIEKIRNGSETYSKRELHLTKSALHKKYKNIYVKQLERKHNIPEHEISSIVNDSLKKFLEKVIKDKSEEVDNPRSYFYIILRNNCYDFHKKNKIEFIDDLNERESKRVDSLTSENMGGLAGMIKEEEDLERENLLSKVKNLISNLGESCREILVGILVEGLTPKEIAATRKKSGKNSYIDAGSVSSRKHECLKKLRKNL